MSTQEENKVLARRFLEAQAKGDLQTLDELMAPDFADRSLLPGQKPGREDYKQSVADMLAVYSNTGFTVEAQIAEGNHVSATVYGEQHSQGQVPGRRSNGPGVRPIPASPSTA